MERIDTHINEIMGVANRKAWQKVLRRVPDDDLERSIKSLAKHCAQKTAQPVRDRSDRREARIAAYNDLVLVFTRFAESQVRLRQAGVYLLLVLIAAAALGTGLTLFG